MLEFAVLVLNEPCYCGGTQVTISEFETLLRREAAGFTVRRQAVALLRQAVNQEQAGSEPVARLQLSTLF